jgi:hypothetical protein
VRPAPGHARNAIRAGIAATFPDRTVRVRPNRSASRPPRRVPATPPVRKYVSDTPATGRLAYRCGDPVKLVDILPRLKAGDSTYYVDWSSR